MSLRRSTSWAGRALGLLFCVGACSDAAREATPHTAPAPTTTTAPTPPAAAPAATDECEADAALCATKNSRRVCRSTPAGRRWTDEPCAAGEGCLLGACTVGRCTDECTVGDVDASGKTCAPWDVTTGAPATPADAGAKLHDRSRAYLGWMGRGPMLAGSIGSPRFADPPALTQLTYMDGLGDSAIWTGTYLAAEALRLHATGAPSARAHVKDLVATVHTLFAVTGEPGVLARYAKKTSTTYPFVVGDLKCPGGDAESHCGVTYGNESWDYVGHISRDQYQGAVLGLALAYDALGPADEAERELIRRDVVTLVSELMKERTETLRLTVDGVPLTKQVTLRFVVIDEREKVDGAISMSVDTQGGGDGTIAGFQEFYPDLADLVRQFPGFSWVPPLERASSAIMLASFFRVALHVTDGVPSYAAQRTAMLDYYVQHTGKGGNVGDWLKVAKKFTPTGGCGGNYYGNNIAWLALYDLARLEDIAAYRPVVVDELLGQTVWPPFATHKNAFFALLYAGAGTNVAPAVVTDALGQLAQFPVPPRVRKAIDLRDDPKYQPHDAKCTDQVSHESAVDVGDRLVTDFMWQRNPWDLHDDGRPGQVEPGIDYLVAYWLARHHGFLDDDTPTSCLGWQ